MSVALHQFGSPDHGHLRRHGAHAVGHDLAHDNHGLDLLFQQVQQARFGFFQSHAPDQRSRSPTVPTPAQAGGDRAHVDRVADRPRDQLYLVLSCSAIGKLDQQK